MRRLLSVLMGLVVAIFLFGVSGNALAQEVEKIGYVNLSQVFDQYQKTIDYDKKLEKKGDKKQLEREKMVSKITKLKDGLELLSEKGRVKKEKKIADKVGELQAFDRSTRIGLKSERDKVVREILGEIEKVVREYGRKEGYFLIFNDRVLLYGAKQSNLTDNILERLNGKYKKN